VSELKPLASVPAVGVGSGLTNGGVDTDHSRSRVDASASQPHFDRKLANCELVDGTDVVLSCRVTGSPMPNVSCHNL